MVDGVGTYLLIRGIESDDIELKFHLGYFFVLAVLFHLARRTPSTDLGGPAYGFQGAGPTCPVERRLTFDIEKNVFG